MQICSDFPAKRLGIKTVSVDCIVIIVRARNKRQVEKCFVLLLLIVVEVNKLLFFF